MHCLTATKESETGLLAEIGSKDECGQNDQDGDVQGANDLLPLHGKGLVVLLVLLWLGPLDKEGKERRTEESSAGIPVVIPRHEHIGKHGKDEGKDDLVLPRLKVREEVDR